MTSCLLQRRGPSARKGKDHYRTGHFFKTDKQRDSDVTEENESH